MIASPYRIGVTSDFKMGIPGRLEPVLAEIFDPLPYVEYAFFDPTGQDERGQCIAPADLAGWDAVLSFGIRYNSASFQTADRLAVLARWGVGYDMVDVPACTAAGVLLAITIDAVRRPVAEAILTFLHALSMRLLEKDRLVRSGRWHERAGVPSVGLRGKSVGSLGIGSIASEMFRLLEPFGLGRKLAFDPYAKPEHAASLGVELVELPTLFAESDFVTINCPLTEQTRGMVNASLLGLMKPTAYLVNTARGPIVNQDDLVATLQAQRIAGAGLDVFAVEPLPADHPLIQLDNVLLTPHALAWNDALYHDTSYDACQSILTVLRGEIPPYVVDRAVLRESAFQTKLALLRERWEGIRAG